MLSSSVFVAVLIRPYLWPTAIGFIFEFAPDRWWSTFPFLPLPDSQILEWRVTTAYGQTDMALAPHEVVSYLQWRRAA